MQAGVCCVGAVLALLQSKGLLTFVLFVGVSQNSTSYKSMYCSMLKCAAVCSTACLDFTERTATHINVVF